MFGLGVAADKGSGASLKTCLRWCSGEVRTRGLLTELSGLGWDPGSMRGGTKEACQKATLLFFRCQIVLRAFCFSTPSICI